MKPRTRWLSLMVVFAVAAGWAQAVSAHADLLSSSPAAGETLPTAPTALTLVFSESLEAAGSHFEVLDAGGRTLPIAGRVDLLDPDHARLIAAPVSGLGAGVYTIQWTALSDDGDGAVSTGEFQFGVGAGAHPRAEALAVEATEAPPPTAVGPVPQAIPSLAAPLLIVVVLGGSAGAMAMSLLRSRR